MAEVAEGLEQVLRDALRALRERRGNRQEDVAQAAREAGLGWTRGTVAAVENGTRHLSAGEFVLLPLVYRVALADLLPEAGRVDVEGAQVEARDLRSILQGSKGVRARLAPRATMPDVSPDDLPDEVAQVQRVMEHLPEARRVALGEAETKAARKLSVESLTVALAALVTWGRSLTEEREHRLDLEAEEGASARSLQALRGHVTRRLLDELGPEIERLTEE